MLLTLHFNGSFYSLTGAEVLVLTRAEVLLNSELLVLSVTKHLISRRKRKKQPGKICQPHQEAGLEIKTLATVLRHQYNLGGLSKKGKGKNLCKRQRKARAKARKLQQTQTEEELLNNRVSLSPVPQLLWGM